MVSRRNGGAADIASMDFKSIQKPAGYSCPKERIAAQSRAISLIDCASTVYSFRVSALSGGRASSYQSLLGFRVPPCQNLVSVQAE